MCLGGGLCTGARATYKRPHHQTKLTLPPPTSPQLVGRPWDSFPDPYWNPGYFDLAEPVMAAES